MKLGEKVPQELFQRLCNHEAVKRSISSFVTRCTNWRSSYLKTHPFSIEKIVRKLYSNQFRVVFNKTLWNSNNTKSTSPINRQVIDPAV